MELLVTHEPPEVYAGIMIKLFTGLRDLNGSDEKQEIDFKKSLLHGIEFCTQILEGSLHKVIMQNMGLLREMLSKVFKGLNTETPDNIKSINRIFNNVVRYFPIYKTPDFCEMVITNTQALTHTHTLIYMFIYLFCFFF